MRRGLAQVAVVAVLVGTMAATIPAGAQNKTLTIKDVMARLHKGPNCLRATLNKALNSDDPNWAEVQRQSKEFAELAEALTKNTPPKGDKDSWNKLSGQFATTAKAMDQAAHSKAKADVVAAWSKLGNCKACHNAHKP